MIEERKYMDQYSPDNWYDFAIRFETSPISLILRVLGLLAILHRLPQAPSPMPRSRERYTKNHSQSSKAILTTEEGVAILGGINPCKALATEVGRILFGWMWVCSFCAFW